ncbi:cupin domain-containing protein [Sutcliffiella rhizosphaerae]|uniref:ChrR-like cupin domain-containing protein n=1 Tax=Sutcliffiella rhizosphaerae TaxID=2880967 RepID=A0ABM8YTW8_9BACI|nr:cupin domain-containing protein [Sutcliffiella rhizosphaerae]CAG9623411.1 hypothetical protein BACCIP111883_04222 [Sutcliffiella rhizosphaerae]
MPIISSKEISWKPGYFQNSEFKMLWEDTETKTKAFIVKFSPGGFIPLHDHPGREFAYVLEGEMVVGEKTLKQGDFLTAGEGELHEVKTENGVTFLIIINDMIKIIE